MVMFTMQLLSILPAISKLFMAKSIFRFLIAIICLSAAACTTTTVVSNKPLPPGQAKKITGSQSAKPFAPGQQKKQAAPAKTAGKKN